MNSWDWSISTADSSRTVRLWFNLSLICSQGSLQRISSFLILHSPLLRQ